MLVAEKSELTERAELYQAYRIDPSFWARNKLDFKSLRGRSRGELEDWLETQPPNSHQWARNQLNAGLLCNTENGTYQDHWLKAMGVDGSHKVTWQTANGVGKTATFAVALLWFLDCFPGGVVITTAGTWAQVEHQLWREIAKWKAGGDLEGTLLSHRLDIAPDWYALGLSTNQPENFEGHHGKYMMLMYDEAKAIKKDIFQAGRRMLQSSKMWWWLIASTPGNPTGGYYEHTQKSDWTHLRLSAYESANCNLDDIVGNATALGEDSPLFRSMVCGQFYESVQNALINREQAELCKPLLTEGDETDISIGCDVARFGPDRTVMMVLKGGNIVETVTRRKWDTQATAGDLIRLRDKYSSDDITPNLVVDDTGLGGGVTDALRTQDANMIAINFGASAPDIESAKHCIRMREFLYWQGKGAIEQRLVGGLPQSLIEELCAHEYRYLPSQKILLSKKEEVKAVLERSPDEADAFCLAWHGTRQAEEMRGTEVTMELIGGGPRRDSGPGMDEVPWTGDEDDEDGMWDEV